MAEETQKPKLLPGVKRAIAVASGKGGVGKSTLAANLAASLAASGLRVGLLDADVYGPSIPTVFGVNEKPKATPENRILPVERHGVKVVSTGFFIPANDAVIWRGPMLHKMIQDLLGVVDWGELDYLFIDLPPGTGDVQLSLCQSIPLAGAVVVSTPQDVAWNVAQKAIVMFDKLNTPVLGIVENMTGEVFGSGGARRAAGRLGIPFLGEIPLESAVRRSADAGTPLVLAEPDQPAARAFASVAKALVVRADAAEKDGGKPLPVKFGPPGQKELLVQWSDGKVTPLDARKLRLSCPCAACVDETTGKRTLREEAVPAEVRIVSVSQVGRYALHAAFSDGHDTGLYAYDKLRTL